MHRSEVLKFLLLRTIGNFLVLFSLVGITLTFGQALYQEGLYRWNVLRGIEYTVASEPTTQEQSGFTSQPPSESPLTITPVDTDFGIVVPKINANARIVPNVDPGSYEDYMVALRVGVAHAAGTVFPGMDGNVYLFAHSTDYFWNVGRYNAIFYLLKELEPGDEVNIFYAGRRYIYAVSEKKIVGPEDISYITNSIGGGQRLTLQTCWPPGTAIKRLIVTAKPKSASSHQYSAISSIN